MRGWKEILQVEEYYAVLGLLDMGGGVMLQLWKINKLLVTGS